MLAANMRLCASWAEAMANQLQVILMIFCNLAVTKVSYGQAHDRNSNSPLY